MDSVQVTVRVYLPVVVGAVTVRVTTAPLSMSPEDGLTALLWVVPEELVSLAVYDIESVVYEEISLNVMSNFSSPLGFTEVSSPVIE